MCTENYAWHVTPTNLEYRPRGLMAENNNCKMIRQGRYAVYYDIKC